MYIGLGCAECGCGQCEEGLGALPPTPLSTFQGLIARLPSRQAVSSSAPSTAPVRTVAYTPPLTMLQRTFGISAPRIGPTYVAPRPIAITPTLPKPTVSVVPVTAPKPILVAGQPIRCPDGSLSYSRTCPTPQSTAIPTGSATGASGGGSMIPGGSPLIPSPGGVEVGTLPDSSKPSFSLASLTGGTNPILLAAGLALFLYSEHDRKKKRRRE